MFPPIQCSKSSFFTQWLISEYLNRINNEVQDGNSNKPLPSPPPPPLQQHHLQLPPQNHGQQQQQQSSSGSVSPTTSSSGSTFSAKNLRQLFSHHHHHKDKLKPNNNEYKNGVTTTQNNDNNLSSCPKRNVEYIQLLALNALEFTAPIYSFRKDETKTVAAAAPTPTATSGSGVGGSGTDLEGISKESTCKCPSTRTFVQLSGHPGSFAPAGPNTVWKKMPEDQTDGELCGRMQVGSGIGMDGSLRDWLQALNSFDHSNNAMQSTSSLDQQTPHHHHQHHHNQNNHHHHHHSNHMNLPSSKNNNLSSTTTTTTPPNTPLPPTSPTKTPITVFFNSSSSSSTSAAGTSSSSSSSSSSTPLLPPQIYDIPTHLLPNETQVYRRVNSTTDPIQAIIPKYVTETCYNSQMFLELEDLLTNFSQPNPTIMDIKLGTRTFLESEVKNNKPRPDLYQKLIAVDPTACTDQEHEDHAVTKLTYMLFREKQSSSNSLGFRVEGIKIGRKGSYDPDQQLKVNFKVLKDERQIIEIFKQFCKHDMKLVAQFRKRLEFIRSTLESSEFFMTHEVIGSSLLFIHDDDRVGVWLIDFAKTFLVPQRLTHRDKWVMGNREDGVLVGVDNIIRLFGEIRT